MPTLTASSTERPDQYLYLEDVDWSQYESMLAAIGDGALRVTYDNGRMEVMSPLPEHEREKMLLGSMVGIIAMERDIPMCAFGSMTIRRKDLAKGLEPDNCYYIQSEPLVRFEKKFDFKKDPAPDLAIEVDVTHRSLPKKPIYAAFGVRELWMYGITGLSFHLLDRGEYRKAKRSAAFPWLSPADLQKFPDQWGSVPETTLLRSFRDWVRETA
jgi:Uma2 family endonuclease